MTLPTLGSDVQCDKTRCMVCAYRSLEHVTVSTLYTQMCVGVF